MFDTILKSSSSKIVELCSKLDHYLSIDTEIVDNVLLWWWEQKSVYPCLSQMALDYLSIPGRSIV